VRDPAPPPLAPDRRGDQHAERHDRGQPARPDQAEGEPAVASGLRVVAVAEQEETIRERADAAVRRFHQPEAQILRRVLDAEEVARDLAGRGQEDDTGGVGVLLLLFVPGVAETDRPGQAADRLRVARQEAPAVPGLRAAVQIERLDLPGPGLLRRVLRVEADRDY